MTNGQCIPNPPSNTIISFKLCRNVRRMLVLRGKLTKKNTVLLEVNTFTLIGHSIACSEQMDIGKGRTLLIEPKNMII